MSVVSAYEKAKQGRDKGDREAFGEASVLREGGVLCPACVCAGFAKQCCAENWTLRRYWVLDLLICAKGEILNDAVKRMLWQNL